MDDGTEVSVEPDIKAVSTVLSIIDRRAKLLGMEQTSVHVNMDVRDSTQNIRAAFANAPGVKEVEKFDPESEAKKLLAVMREAGVLPENVVNELLGNIPALSESYIEDAEVIEDDESSDSGDSGA
jgi:hypothetical protein